MEKTTKEGYELVYIQSNLKAPKNQRNNFGGYNYRSCEDILEAVKPLLAEVNCVLTVKDDIILIGDRYYVKATAILHTPSGVTFENTAFAREPQEKKGMDSSQITGMASSYARKYALNGLFCIDDTKDADSMNNNESPAPAIPETPAPAPQNQEADIQMSMELIKAINNCKTLDELTTLKNNQVEPLKSCNKLKNLLNARYNAIKG